MLAATGKKLNCFRKCSRCFSMFSPVFASFSRFSDVAVCHWLHCTNGTEHRHRRKLFFIWYHHHIYCIPAKTLLVFQVGRSLCSKQDVSCVMLQECVGETSTATGHETSLKTTYLLFLCTTLCCGESILPVA